MYFVPWLSGPNEFDRPFGLDTKYGHLVFVFSSQDNLYNEFFKASEDMLKSGFLLKSVMLSVSGKEQLNSELATRMPNDQAFGVVIEGTDSFSRLMKELANDTIWSE